MIEHSDIEVLEVVSIKSEIGELLGYVTVSGYRAIKLFGRKEYICVLSISPSDIKNFNSMKYHVRIVGSVIASTSVKVVKDISGCIRKSKDVKFNFRGNCFKASFKIENNVVVSNYDICA